MARIVRPTPRYEEGAGFAGPFCQSLEGNLLLGKLLVLRVFKLRTRVVVSVVVLVEELLLLGRAGEGGGGRDAAGDDLGNVVEVAGADLALVLGRCVAVLLAVDLALLQLGVGGHAPLPVVAG